MTKEKKETKKKSTKTEASSKQIKQLEAQIIELQQQVLDVAKERDDLIAGSLEAKDQSLRSMAELENVKRRKEQEKVDAIKFANERLIMDLLPVLDSFEFVDSKQDGASSQPRISETASSPESEDTKSSTSPTINKEDALDDDVPF